MSNDGSNDRIGFIGGGNMAQALIKGLLESGCPPSRVQAAEPSARTRRLLERGFGVGATDSNLEVVRSARTVILAVKPQVMPEVLAELRGATARSQRVISIAAGVRISTLESALAPARVIRVMPNTPCLVGKGASVICAGRLAKRADVAVARSLLSSVGRVYVVEAEDLLDAVTGLSGSGPAYVYLFAEALMRAGVEVGLDARLASDLTLQTISGAAEMMLQTGQSPVRLREAVTSPGGTTEAALTTLRERGFAKTLSAAVKSATRRSRQLGKT